MTDDMFVRECLAVLSRAVPPSSVLALSVLPLPGECLAEVGARQV